MTPPLVAHALVAAASPPADYESIAGDLQEEYIRRVRVTGVGAANRWYWSQALRSIPSLVSYSRTPRSWTAALATVTIVIGVLLALMFATDRLDAVFTSWYGERHTPMWVSFSANWIDAALFGAVLAFLLRSHGVRLALWASFALVASVVIPTALGFSSRLPLLAWVLIVGAIPAMSAGAAAYQIIRRHLKD